MTARRTVALVLVVDLPEAPGTSNAPLTDRILAAARAAGMRVRYVEAHDDLHAVLDEDTADRWSVTQ